MNRLLRLGACLSLITALFVAAVLAAPSHGLAQDGATDGSLQSIAHGAVTLPTGSLAWRVVADQAGDRDSAASTAQSLGFTLATDGSVLIETPATGTQDLLLPGSAAFVPDGAVATRSGVDGETSYDEISLVPADQASDAGAGELLLGGEGFAVPTGNRAIDLSRAVLAPGQTVTSPALDSQTPSLVLATDGSVDVSFADGAITLAAGSAAVLDGELTITSVDGGTVVVGTIGAEVLALEATSTDATATPSVAATPSASSAGTPVAGGQSGDGIDESGDDGTGGDATGSGTLAIEVLDCSAGTLLDTTSCAPLAGVTVSVVVAGAEAGGVTDGSGQLAPVEVAVGAPVTVSSVTGGPEGLDLLNVPFAIPAFEGDTQVPIVFDTPDVPVTDTPADGDPTTDPATGGTPVAGGAVATLTVQALDCRDGDLATLEGCVAMPNATFSVTRGLETDSVESGFTTDANGYVTFTADAGSSVTATYAFGAPTGVAPNNDGQVLEPVDGDSTLTFVFVDVNDSNG